MSPTEWFTPQYDTWKAGFILHSQNLPVPQSLWTSIRPFITMHRNSFHFYNSGMLYAPRSSPSSASADPVLSLRCSTQMMYWPGCQTTLIFLLFILFFMSALTDVSPDWYVSPANVLLSLCPPQFHHPSMRLKATASEWAAYLCYGVRQQPCPRQRLSGTKVKKGESRLTV